MNYEDAIEQICDQLKEFMEDAGAKKAVVGLSGGIDSSVIAYLCVKALGEENVVGISMPYDKQDQSDALLVAEKLGIPCNIVNILPMVSSFPDHLQRDKLQKGNIMARVRMTVLYAYANTLGGLVIGTTNKTEAMIGYYTKWGDGAVDVEPIAELYKTDVWEVGKILGVPKCIINKAPSAGLWEDQTDEGELGMTYKELDKILKKQGDGGFSLLGEGFSGAMRKKAVKVAQLRSSTQHKREMPESFKIYTKTTKIHC